MKNLKTPNIWKHRTANVAFAVMLLAVGVIIFEVATLSVLNSESAWLKAAPTLIPFLAFIATMCFSLSKDNWVAEVAAKLLDVVKRRSLLLFILAMVFSGVAVVLGHYTWQLSNAKEGTFIIRIVERDDVPDQAVTGIPVTLEHRLKTDVAERITDSSGMARFEVDLSDVFAVRIRRTATSNSSIFVVASDAHVEEHKKTGYTLVRLADIPEQAWVRPRIEVNSSTAADADFAQLPPEFFRWRASGSSSHVINAETNLEAFPFELPGAETIIRRVAFTVGYSPVLRLPRWAAYRVIPGPSIRRDPDNFTPDPSIPSSYQARSVDYMANDFDRGHLVRRSDLFGLGPKAVTQINLFSVVVPQLSYVNQKTWLALEDYTSKKALNGDTVYVIRGPIYEASGPGKMVNLTLMSSNCIPVPTHFFQVLYRGQNGKFTQESHIVPNSYVSFIGKDIAQFNSTVDAIAEKTGLHFESK